LNAPQSKKPQHSPCYVSAFSQSFRPNLAQIWARDCEGYLLTGPKYKSLTSAEYQKLADVPPELEWFANIDNQKTRRAYQIDLEDFTGFAGIRSPDAMRTVTRAHVLAWPKHLETREAWPCHDPAEAFRVVFSL